MKTPHAVIVGMGQLGRTLGEGLLMQGITVTPILRSTAIDSSLSPETVIVATGEDDLAGALERLPQSWKSQPSIVLLQNELLPPQWENHGVSQPTIFVVWFERKPGKLITPLLPSIVFGPQQDIIQSAMDHLGIPCEIAAGEDDILTQLVIKNAYIWTTNISSLYVGPLTTGVLHDEHASLVDSLIKETVAVQQAIIGRSFDFEKIASQVNQALLSDPLHNAGGRSAKRRLERFLAHAHNAGISVPQAQLIAEHQGITPRA
ncbi:MAG: hypothetical protein C7B47_03480 [Sulfobacillus thermosulfidooxidans]|uniref:Ketopantoate reductase n=1 Tax=Sulfobacillus thermosulfidooxidans TaxID=28034 RepID=A0A2T2X3F6_SULTH|nr:MAG: hypothetical protein C7B47_03480 [Sulfobacillus thermosulfidooxidans]